VNRVLAARLLAAALLVPLAGCDLDLAHLGPDYLRPIIDPPPSWTTVDAKTQSPWPSAQWWRGFASPELDDLMAQAQMANFDLGAAVARVREADAQARIAGAPLLPAVNVSASATREQTGATAVGTNVTSSAYNSSEAYLTATYELDFWGKNKAALEAARQTVLANRYNREVVALTVVSGVATSYFQVLGLRDRIAAAESNIKIAENVLDALRTEQQVGAGIALDVVQQETQVAALRAQIPPLRQQMQQGIDALAILLGKLPETVTVRTAGLGSLTAPEVSPGLPSELLLRRPDIAQAEASLIAANANIRNARAQWFPSITLTGEGGVTSTSLTSFFSPATILYELTGAIAQPIFEGGKLQGQVDLTKAQYEELENDYRKSVVSAFSNVEDALAAVKQTREQVALLQDEVDKARQSYDIALQELRVGTSNLLTVLTIENTLFPAQDSLLQARSSYYQALVSLFQALGGGWQRSDVKLPDK
jgi:NodT family efflux transporter outer membrane factor (OMF) lipoprotein